MQRNFVGKKYEGRLNVCVVFGMETFAQRLSNRTSDKAGNCSVPFFISSNV